MDLERLTLGDEGYRAFPQQVLIRYCVHGRSPLQLWCQLRETGYCKTCRFIDLGESCRAFSQQVFSRYL